jgi:hypothetical protein
MDDSWKRGAPINPENVPEWKAYKTEKSLRESFRRVPDNQAVLSGLSAKRGLLFVVDETDRAHRWALLSIIDKLRQTPASGDTRTAVAYTFCDRDSNAKTLSGNLLRMLLFSIDPGPLDKLEEPRQFDNMDLTECSVETLLEILCNVTGEDTSTVVYFAVGGVDQRRWDMMQPVIASTARLVPQLRWIISSSSEIQPPPALRHKAATLVVSFRDAIEWLLLDRVAEAMHDAAGDEDPMGAWQEAPAQNVANQDSAVNHWLPYTIEGREWLSGKSVILQFQQMPEDTPDSVCQTATTQGHFSKLLGEFSHLDVCFCPLSIPAVEHHDSQGRIESEVLGLLWSIFSKIGAWSFKTELSLQQHLIELPETSLASLRVLLYERSLSSFSSQLMLGLFSPIPSSACVLLLLEFDRFSNAAVAAKLLQIITEKCDIESHRVKIVLSYSQGASNFQQSFWDVLNKQPRFTNRAQAVSSLTEYNGTLPPTIRINSECF